MLENGVENKEIEHNTKEIDLSKKSLIMDINMIEAPLFNFNERQKLCFVDDLLKSDDIANNVKEVLKSAPDDVANTKVGFRQWKDSKENTRAILSVSPFKFPNSFCMDVLYGIIYIYTHKQNPLLEIDGKYELKTNKVTFKMTELCEVMGLSACGTSYQRIKEAFRRLGAVSYYSLEDGSLYDKEQNKYISSKENMVSLINGYTLTKDSKDEYSSVKLGDLIISNLIHKHIKFLEKNMYFSLQTGLTRRLYSYIEGNSYGKDYLKRSFDVLKNKLPVDFDYPYVLKRRLKTPLENLKMAGIIVDYFYGDGATCC